MANSLFTTLKITTFVFEEYNEGMKTISVCMIVKNEEKHLSRILECAKKFADEIIVVDTGSTDNTKTIAKIYTPNVYTFSWCNDFSKARNFSFSKATCDYIMWLDADDYISQKNIKAINQLKQTMSADVYMLKYAIAFNEQNKPTFEYYRERILKRSKNFVWQGFIHEAIVPSGEIEYKEISIYHKKIHQVDAKRNLKIFRQKIRNGEKLDARLTYYYARELYYNKYYSKCIKTLKCYLKMKNLYAPNQQDAYTIISNCYKTLGDIKNAIKYLNIATQLFCPTPEICCLLAELYIITKNKKLAIFWYRNCFNCPQNNQGFVNKNYEILVPALCLCKLYYEIGDIKQSLFFHELTKKYFPKNKSVEYNTKFFNNLNKK